MSSDPVRRRHPLLDYFVPRNNEVDWPLVPYQPVLYSVLWVALAATVFAGKVLQRFEITVGLMPEVWTVTILTAPVVAMVALWMIQKRRGIWTYRGFWLRLFADIAMASGLTSYTIVRWTTPPLPFIAGSICIASTIFVYLLCARDIRTIYMTNQIADVLQRHKDDGL